MSPTLTFEPGGALRSRLVSRLLADSAPTLAPGTVLGPFRVLHVLGHGGLGVVYLAERADGAFDQKVALKLIAPEADPGIAEVLLARERQLLARLRHPNIARLLDGGRSEGGLLWFAMDHVEGTRIDVWCDERGLDLRARVRLLVDVCAAVAYAHARLVVHRDIKPSNILVDADGVPRLLDFGIAAALDDASDDPARRAATPGYASPEQHRGDPAGVGHDVYQLGRLLERLQRDVAKGRDRDDIDAILGRALAEQPERRYASVDAFAADLRALLDHRPLAARDNTPAYRFSRLLRRHRIAASAIALGTLGVVAIVAGFLWHLDRARDEAEREARTARHVSEFMVSLFRAADPALHHGTFPTVDVVLAQAPERIDRELADDPAVRAELLATIGRTYVALRDYGRATPALRKAVDLTRQLPDTDVLVRAERLRMLAMAAGITESGDVRSLFTEALEGLDAASPEHARTYNILQQNLAMQELSDGDVAQAIERLERALAHGRRLLDPGQPALMADLLGLGSALLQVERHEDALVHFREAHASAREHLGEKHPYTILASGNLAIALAHTGRHAEAMQPMNDTVAAALQLYGSPSPNYVLALLQRGEVVGMAGRNDEAIAILREALAVCDQLPPENDTLGVDVLEALGDRLLASGNVVEATTTYRAMLERNRDGKHAQNADVGQRTIKLARALAAQGQCEEAETVRQAARRRAAASSSAAAAGEGADTAAGREAAAFDAPLAGCVP